MKLLTTIFTFTLLSCSAFSQDYIINVLDNGKGQYRFSKHEVRQFETVTDTLLIDIFPEKWCDSTEFSNYTLRLIASLKERENELKRLDQLTKQETDLYVSFYDQKNGTGAYLALQKNQLLENIAGNWKLIDKNGETISTDNVTITGNVIRKNANKSGTISITDDMDILLTGYFNFDLTFRIAQNGTLRADRNGRTFTMKRA